MPVNIIALGDDYDGLFVDMPYGTFVYSYEEGWDGHGYGVYVRARDKQAFDASLSHNSYGRESVKDIAEHLNEVDIATELLDKEIFDKSKTFYDEHQVAVLEWLRKNKDVWYAS